MSGQGAAHSPSHLPSIPTVGGAGPAPPHPTSPRGRLERDVHGRRGGLSQWPVQLLRRAVGTDAPAAGAFPSLSTLAAAALRARLASLQAEVGAFRDRAAQLEARNDELVAGQAPLAGAPPHVDAALHAELAALRVEVDALRLHNEQLEARNDELERLLAEHGNAAAPTEEAAAEA